MTTRKRISALRNECDDFAEQTLQCKGEFHPDFHAVSDERLYAIAHEAGAASRDAEIEELLAALKPFGAIDLVESRLPAEFAMLILRARAAIAKVRKP